MRHDFDAVAAAFCRSSRQVGAVGSGAGPQLLGVEIGHQRGQAADVILVRVRERHHIDAADAAVPQVGRHHVFADIELRPGPGGRTAGMPPPSTSMRLPSGKTTRMLSPWPTSMAVISNSPGWMSGGNGCHSSSASSTATASAGRRCATSGRAPGAAAISAARRRCPATAAAWECASRARCAACQCDDRLARATAARPPILATHAQPVNTATKPTGTARPISGTTKALAERPERPTR